MLRMVENAAAVGLRIGKSQIVFFVQGEQNMTREQTRSAEVWPRRLPASIEPPVVSLWDNLSVSARRYPKKTALTFFDCRITYEELAGAAENGPRRLHTAGAAWLHPRTDHPSRPCLRSPVPESKPLEDRLFSL